MSELERESMHMRIALRAADGMARVIDDWVRRGLINTRSAAADARLDFGTPYVYEWSKKEESKP